MKLPSPHGYAFWLALVRIYTGIFWLMHGVPKFTQSEMFMPPGGFMVQFIQQAITHTSGPYQHFLQNVVLPNAWLFAELSRLGEVTAGLLLLLGFYSRLGGIVGAILALNYLSAQGGLAHLRFWSGLDSTAFVLSLISVVLPTGRFLGIDGVLHALRRRSHPVAAPAPEQPVFVDEPPMTGPQAPSA